MLFNLDFADNTIGTPTTEAKVEIQAHLVIVKLQ